MNKTTSQPSSSSSSIGYQIIEEFLLGGTAASIACLVTNPLEVIKTRLQLQGELKASGQYVRLYNNIFQAGFVIAKNEGILALQKGLCSGILYQMTMNGVRLGSYQMFQRLNFHLNEDTGHISYARTVLLASLSGTLGAAIASPFYLVKTQIQAKSASSLAVGHQHNVTGAVSALYHIVKSQGILAAWRGWQAQVIRVAVGSSVQLSSHMLTKNYLHTHWTWCNGRHVFVSFISSTLSSLLVAIFMSPFDVIATRIYNQPIDPLTGRGLYYTGVFNAFKQVLKKEGPFGLYKGSAAVFVRVGPHTIISLTVWDFLRRVYHQH